MSEGYPEVSEEDDDWEEGGEAGEDLADDEWPFEFDDYALGEGVGYPPGGEQTPENEDDLTTDGDYPPTPHSGPDFTMDEPPTSDDERSVDNGSGDGLEDGSSGMWSWLTTDSDVDEDDPSDPDYMG